MGEKDNEDVILLKSEHFRGLRTMALRSLQIMTVNDPNDFLPRLRTTTAKPEPEVEQAFRDKDPNWTIEDGMTFKGALEHVVNFKTSTRLFRQVHTASFQTER